MPHAVDGFEVAGPLQCRAAAPSGNFQLVGHKRQAGIELHACRARERAAKSIAGYISNFAVMHSRHAGSCLAGSTL